MMQRVDAEVDVTVLIECDDRARVNGRVSFRAFIKIPIKIGILIGILPFSFFLNN